MITIEPFDYSDEAYATAITINAAVFGGAPDPVAEWKHDDETWNPAYPYYRDFVRRDGAIVGYVETSQSPFAYHPQKYECRIYVDPARDGPDVRPVVLTFILERLRDKDLIALKSGMLDDKPEAMRFFAEYGFETMAEEKISILDVTAFNPDRFADRLAAVGDNGIEILSLRALQQRDPDWQRKLYDLDVAVSRDIPSTGDKYYPAFDKWLESRLAGPKYDPDAWFIAVDDGRYVAHTQGSVHRESDPVEYVTGVTATRREYRRRGLATALKVHSIAYLKEQGVAEIFTTNDSKNPMYQLNLALGFQPQPSWVRVEKQLKS